MAEAQPNLDVVTLGRCSADLYGDQVGGRLEEMASFSKYIGGCPANIAVGTSRLGLTSAIITGVGDEHIGRFIQEELAREGVVTRGIKTDPQRLTGVVILGIRSKDSFPLIFYRENCADGALQPEDVDESLIAGARALLVTGTHFATDNLDRTSRQAMTYARRHGVQVLFDIDYRPVLWGLTGHGLGEERFVASQSVTDHLQSILPECDLIVGTEEEIHIAGGTTDTLAAIKAIRAHSDGTIVCKRGPMGCVVLPGTIPDSLEDGITGPGFPVDVFNVLGAGDAFYSGFLRGYLRGADYGTCATYANACGAFAVSRHGCAPAVPSWTELQDFLAQGSPTRSLRRDARLNQLHWSTTRQRHYPEVCAIALDHRDQFEALADKHGADRRHISTFKALGLDAARTVTGGNGSMGVLLDDRYAGDALATASGLNCWVGRPIELPKTTPLQFEGGPDAGSILREWPVGHTVKCLVFYHPDDGDALRGEQLIRLRQLMQACRSTRHDLLVEIVATQSDKAVDSQTVPRAMAEMYDHGIYPDWWKLAHPAGGAAGWQAIAATIDRYDPYCRGVLLLGLDAPVNDLGKQIREAARQPICKGFAVGRTIFGEPADAWLAGEIDGDTARDRMVATYRRLIDFWRAERPAPTASYRDAQGRDGET